MAFSAGIITTNNEALAAAMRALCQSGEDTWVGEDAGSTRDGSCAVDPGKIDEDWAVCTFPDLRRLDELLKIRRRYARMYSATLRNVSVFSVPFVRRDVGHAWQVYALRLHPEQLAADRGGFVEALRGENIEVKAHPVPVHLHPDYRLGNTFQRGQFPVAERMAESTVSLPLSEIMTEMDVVSVIATVKRIADRYRR